MIQVIISYKKERIHSFVVSGHAESGPYGYDLVCAAVSAVTFGAVNAVLEITKAALEIEQGEGGYLAVTLPNNLSDPLIAKADLLLQGMVISLETIERDYDKHLSISKKGG